MAPQIEVPRSLVVVRTRPRSREAEGQGPFRSLGGRLVGPEPAGTLSIRGRASPYLAYSAAGLAATNVVAAVIEPQFLLLTGLLTVIGAVLLGAIAAIRPSVVLTPTELRARVNLTEPHVSVRRLAITEVRCVPGPAMRKARGDHRTLQMWSVDVSAGDVSTRIADTNTHVEASAIASLVASELGLPAERVHLATPPP